MTKQVDAAKNVSQNFIFDHPTVHQLANAIHALVYPEGNSKPDSNLQQTRHMIAKYTANMPEAHSRKRKSGGSAVVLLTGSTGNLGTHILAALLADEGVSRVWTLDRSSSDTSTADRLAAAFADRGLPLDILSSSKLTSLTGSFNLPYFGQHQDVYNEVRNVIMVASVMY